MTSTIADVASALTERVCGVSVTRFHGQTRAVVPKKAMYEALEHLKVAEQTLDSTRKHDPSMGLCRPQPADFSVILFT